jgi:acetyl-CoA synthetase
MPDQVKGNKGKKNQPTEEKAKSISPPKEFKSNAYFSSFNQYKSVYDFSIRDSERFWSNEAKELFWFKPWKEVKTGNAFNSKWFVGGKTNISYNCLDRHITSEKRNKAALIWESENGESRIFTYQVLLSLVNRFANALKNLGVKKGDNTVIYMGLVPETVVAILACARIGAVYAIIYSGLSSNALSERIKKLNCKVIITQDFISRKGEAVPLKENIDNAVAGNDEVKIVVVHRRMPEREIRIYPDRDKIWSEVLQNVQEECPPVQLDSQQPVFNLFTNGPKGDLVQLMHTLGGYMVQVYLTTKWVFDIRSDDIFWSTADIGWISGHSYGIYGPLLNGATVFMYEGLPVYPEPDRYWQLISRYRINILYSNPTTLRALSKLGNEWVYKHDLSSLRLLGTKGEPIKPETWQWFYEVIGRKNCPVVDTWIQSETGAIVLSTLPGAEEMIPGSSGTPFPGIELEVTDLSGNTVQQGEAGYLVIKDSWPSMFTTKKEEKSETKLNCWKQVKGSYFTGDAAIRESNDYIRILGRVDDVIKAAGHRVGGSQIEKLLATHPSVKEAAVVKRPDEIIGNAIIVYVTLNETAGTPLLKEELRNFVAENIGTLAKPDELIFLDEFPRLEDNIIDRRVLREKALVGTQPLKDEEKFYFDILEELREKYQKRFMK